MGAVGNNNHRVVQIQPERRRFNQIESYLPVLGFCTHLALVAVFLFLKVPQMILLESASTLVWLALLIAGRRGWSALVFSIGGLETAAHTVLAVWILGWDSGFHYNILLGVLVFFFYPARRSLAKAYAGLAVALFYISLFVASLMVEPLARPAAPVEAALNAFNIVAVIFSFAVVSRYYSQAVIRAEQELKKANRKLEHQATTDPLTTLINRRSMQERIHSQVLHFVETGKPFALVLADVDNFKAINDQYGHPAGDYVLVALANLMRTNLRSQDQIARWGGEEFLLLLPDTNLLGASIAAEKLRQKIEATPFFFRGLPLAVTLTFGAAVYDQIHPRIERCIYKADQALYAGKQSGKNCVVFWDGGVKIFPRTTTQPVEKFRTPAEL